MLRTYKGTFLPNFQKRNGVEVQPYVIVLILSYNGRSLLIDSIESYLKNSYSSFDIVVIDNGSTDNTQEFVEENYPSVELLRLPVNQGYSGGFNAGLTYAFNKKKADYVLVTNNDVKVDQHIIENLVDSAMSRDKIGFTIGKTYFFDEPDKLQSVGKEHDDKLWSGRHIGGYELDEGQYEQVEIRAWCDDIYWLISKELYLLEPGYDTEFQFQAEDFEWQVRAKKRGYKILYTPRAKLWHKDSATIGKKSAFKIYYDFRNPLIVHMKHRDYSDFRPFLAYKRRHLFIVLIKSILGLRFKYAYRSFLGYFSAMKWGLKHQRLTFIQIFK